MLVYAERRRVVGFSYRLARNYIKRRIELVVYFESEGESESAQATTAHQLAFGVKVSPYQYAFGHSNKLCIAFYVMAIFVPRETDGFINVDFTGRTRWFF